MTNKIAAYKKAKEDLAQAAGWAEKIGKVYYGGTRGAGAFGRITSAAVQATVYHQRNDGDTNYHLTPEGLRLALAEVFIERHDELIAAALLRMNEKVVELANGAVEELATLMQEAGLA